MSDRPSTAADWAERRRSITTYTVKECRDIGDSYEFSTTTGTGFVRSKTDVGAPFATGDIVALETVNYSYITGLRDAAGAWRFHLTDQDLADQANERHRVDEERRTADLERNMKRYAAAEEALPDWLRARIQRFRDAAGEKFLRDGWGYELAISRLAEAYAGESLSRIEDLDEELGCSGNQHGCAKLLAELHAAGRDDEVALVPAGLSPLTGSADYA